jgi:peptidoglycan hydrolase-like protein with peptidoglycan-binding domain
VGREGVVMMFIEDISRIMYRKNLVVLLKVGDRSSGVAQLQQLLDGKPSKLPPLKPDGIFGLKTQAESSNSRKTTGSKRMVSSAT